MKNQTVKNSGSKIKKGMFMEINGVKIGDRFIDSRDRKSKRVSTVVDFQETKSVLTGEIIKRMVVAQHDFLGQKMTIIVPFSSVKRNRV